MLARLFYERFFFTFTPTPVHQPPDRFPCQEQQGPRLHCLGSAVTRPGELDRINRIFRIGLRNTSSVILHNPVFLFGYLYRRNGAKFPLAPQRPSRTGVGWKPNLQFLLPCLVDSRPSSARPASPVDSRNVGNARRTDRGVISSNGPGLARLDNGDKDSTSRARFVHPSSHR